MSRPVTQGVRVWLSLPPRVLHPNGRTKKLGYLAALTRTRVEDAYYSTLGALNGSRLAEAPDYSVTITVLAAPKAAHQMDRNNIGRWFKADTDGISEALGVDDKHFQSPQVSIEPERDASRRGAWIEVWAVQDTEERSHGS